MVLHTAVIVRNLSPASGFQQVPVQAFHLTPVDVSNLRGFGCAAYVHEPAKFQTKLHNQRQKGIFIGYESLSAGIYCVLVDGKVVL